MVFITFVAENKQQGKQDPPWTSGARTGDSHHGRFVPEIDLSAEVLADKG